MYLNILRVKDLYGLSTIVYRKMDSNSLKAVHNVTRRIVQQETNGC